MKRLKVMRLKKVDSLSLSSWLTGYVDVGHCWIGATQFQLMNRDHDKKLYDIRKVKKVQATTRKMCSWVCVFVM
jgi:hypothetical protein